MLKTKIIEGDRNTFVRELERAEADGWAPNMQSKRVVMVKTENGQFAHHSLICQRWVVD
jgi:stage III sporulation protein SpoIIIAA